MANDVPFNFLRQLSASAIWDALSADQRAGLLAAIEASRPTPRLVPDRPSDARSDAYDKVDRFLRNTLMDAAYAEYSEALDLIAAAPPAEAPCTCPSGDGSLRHPCPTHPAEAPADTSGGPWTGRTDAESLARHFHDAYERLAPSFGYETRQDTRAFDPATPNGRLMIAVCGELRTSLVAEAPAERGDEALALHWIDRYAAGIDCEPQMDRIREALALAPEDGDWYVSPQGSVCIDWDGNPQRQLSLLLKQDGTVSYAAYVDGHTYRGDAMLIDFTTALPLPAQPDTQP